LRNSLQQQDYFNFIVSLVENGVKREFGLFDEFGNPPAGAWMRPAGQ
jgi:hypothetical protein